MARWDEAGQGANETDKIEQAMNVTAEEEERNPQHSRCVLWCCGRSARWPGEDWVRQADVVKRGVK